MTRATITPSARIADLIGQMTLDEKLSFVTPSKDPSNPGSVINGSAAYLPGVPRLGVPELRYTDGTAGLRLPVPATAYPAPTMLGSSFDPSLAYTYGNTLGTEARAAKQDVVLGPLVTVIRQPQGGRNYEAYSEDPLVVAQIAGSQVKGMQAAGEIATIKHLAMNDQETNKSAVSVDVSDQALHEVHLPGFQAGVDAGAGAAMCAYNKVNGVYSCSNDELMNKILKSQMKFQGYVMSDWGVTKSVTDMNAGLDQEMFWVGIQQPKLTSALRTALNDGTVPMSALDDAVARILTSMDNVGLLDGANDHRPSFDLTTGAAVAQKIAEEGGVLLKNGGTLPLQTGKTVAVFGESSITPKYTGVASAAVSSPDAAAPLQTITARAGATVSSDIGVPSPVGIPTSALADPTGFPFDANGMSTASNLAYSGTLSLPDPGAYNFSASAPGGSVTVTIDGTRIASATYGAGTGTVNLTAGAHTLVLAGTGAAGSVSLKWTTPAATSVALQEASSKAASADTAVVFASDVINSDRSLALSDAQNNLISAVAAANPHTVVVLNAASAVAMPWIDKVDGVLDMYYPGVNGAQATTALLFGDVNPSGKLTQTFPVSDAQTPFAGNASQYPGVNNVVSYSEGVDIGYRGYEKKNIKPLFSFGYGLSYTTFSYGTPQVRQQGDSLLVSVKVTNTGTRTGKEVVQAYGGPSANVTAQQSERKLVGFTKVSLAAGESKMVEFPVGLHQMEYWDTDSQSWKLGTGNRRFWVAGSSADLSHTTTARIYNPVAGVGPKVTLSATPTAPASGWNNGPVTVTADVDDDAATTYVSIDSGKLHPYDGPVQVAGDGTHTVRAFAVGADEQYSDIVETTVRIDATAPNVSGSATKGVLRLTGSDAQSGIATLQYSTNGGSSWKTYSKPVTFTGAPRTVTYRATDAAGNTSAPKTVNVPGKFAGKARITGKNAAGRKVAVSTTGWPAATKFTYKWTAAGKTVGTSRKITIKKAWRGKTLKVTVKATKIGYTPASAKASVRIRR